jgi:hypothetical protein
MQINDLKAIGAFVPSKLIERTVKFQRPIQKPESEWEHPDIPEFTGEIADESVTVWIRRGTAADAIELMQAERREQPFVAIFRSVCHKDGTSVFESVEQAESLQLWLAMPLFEAITEVAGKTPKASRRRTSSGSKPASPTASPKQS